jgi:Protein of unknown function (DUF2953)
MNWIFIVTGILFVLFCILLLSRLQISFYFVHRNDKSDIQVTFRMYRFIKYTLKVPLIQLDAEDHSIKIREETQAAKGQNKEKKKRITFQQLNERYHTFQNLLKHVQHFYGIIAGFLKKIKVAKVEWHSAVGLGEAPSSAIAAGTIWSIKGIVLQLLNKFFLLEGKPSISVVPVYQGLHSETRFSCMISFKIGHAIVVMLKMLKAWRMTGRSSQENTEYLTGGM